MPRYRVGRRVRQPAQVIQTRTPMIELGALDKSDDHQAMDVKTIGNLMDRRAAGQQRDGLERSRPK
jgi:hypothetical protein